MSGYTDHLPTIAVEDARFLAERDRSYGSSWKKRGGVGAFMMLARKMDRLDELVKNLGSQANPTPYDVFAGIEQKPKGEDGSVLAEVRDLRRYLLLVEAEMVERGVVELPKPRQVAAPQTVIQGIGGGGGKFSGSLTIDLGKEGAGGPGRFFGNVPPGAPSVPVGDSSHHGDRLPRQVNHTELMELPRDDQRRYRFREDEQSYVLQEGRIIGGKFWPLTIPSYDIRHWSPEINKYNIDYRQQGGTSVYTLLTGEDNG